jgi:hypothetical protein
MPVGTELSNAKMDMSAMRAMQEVPEIRTKKCGLARGGSEATGTRDESPAREETTTAMQGRENIAPSRGDIGPGPAPHNTSEIISAMQ